MKDQNFKFEIDASMSKIKSVSYSKLQLWFGLRLPTFLYFCRSPYLNCLLRFCRWAWVTWSLLIPFYHTSCKFHRYEVAQRKVFGTYLKIPYRTKLRPIGQNFVGQNFRNQVEISTISSNFCLTFVLKYGTKFSTDKIFRRTKFSTPSQNFDTFVWWIFVP